MIDIIIPVVSTEIDLEKTLMSIYLQEIEEKYNVIILDKKTNEEIIKRYSSFYPIKYIETDIFSIDFKNILLNETTSPYIVIINNEHLFYNVQSLATLYKKSIKENQNIQGIIENNNNYEISTLNSVIYKRELLYNESFIESDEIITIKNEKNNK